MLPAVAQEDRGRREVVAQEAEQRPGQGDGHARRRPLALHARHAAMARLMINPTRLSRPSMPSIRLSELIAASSQNAVKGTARRPSSSSQPNSRTLRTTCPKPITMTAASDLAEQLVPAAQEAEVVGHADQADQDAGQEQAHRAGWRWQQLVVERAGDQRATATAVLADRHRARPPATGVARVWTLRRPSGWSTRRIRDARLRASGVSSRQRAKLTPKTRTRVVIVQDPPGSFPTARGKKLGVRGLNAPYPDYPLVLGLRRPTPLPPPSSRFPVIHGGTFVRFAAHPFTPSAFRRGLRPRRLRSLAQPLPSLGFLPTGDQPAVTGPPPNLKWTV